MNKQELIDILSSNANNEWLFNRANQVRKENVGDEIHLRGLIEFFTCGQGLQILFKSGIQEPLVFKQFSQAQQLISLASFNNSSL